MRDPPPGLEIPFDRITWRDGQPLTSRDIRDEKHNDDRFRYLHVRYLHAVWGVASGFEVTALDQQSVNVAPGIAFDSEGREMVLSETVTLTLPILPVAFLVLVARFAADDTYRRQRNLGGLCPNGIIAPTSERPEFLWRAADEVQMGPEVPLAGAWVDIGKLQGPLYPDMRRFARGEVQPSCFAGETQAGQTGWTLRTDPNAAGVTWLQTEVDTSEAGFVYPPYYFARIDSPSPLAFPSGPPALFIQDYEASRFTVCVFHRAELPLATQLSGQQAEDAQWTISWLAIEAPRLDFIVINEQLP
jgi:hypothetical protein